MLRTIARIASFVANLFYHKLQAVREFALLELRANAYCLYDSADWSASRFRQWHQCPFKASYSLINALVELTGEAVHVDHWRQSYPEYGSKADKANPFRRFRTIELAISRAANQKS